MKRERDSVFGDDTIEGNEENGVEHCCRIQKGLCGCLNCLRAILSHNDLLRRHGYFTTLSDDDLGLCCEPLENLSLRLERGEVSDRSLQVVLDNCHDSDWIESVIPFVHICSGSVADDLFLKNVWGEIFHLIENH